MTKPTPGPWKSALAIISNAPSQYVITIGKWGAPTIAIADSEANARLIAAAPELLKALRRCLGDDTGGLEPETVHLAMEAIAKAEGREE